MRTANDTSRYQFMQQKRQLIAGLRYFCISLNCTRFKIKVITRNITFLWRKDHWSDVVFVSVDGCIWSSLNRATFHLTIFMRGQRPAGKIQRNKVYFSLNDFWHSDASLAWRSKTPTSFYPLMKATTPVMVIIPLNLARCTLPTHGNRQVKSSLKPQLHDAIYRLRFYSNSLIHILSLSNSYNNVASIQKNRGDKSQRVIVALECIWNEIWFFGFFNILSPWTQKLISCFSKFETPAIKLKIDRYLSPICGELCLRGQRVQWRHNWEDVTKAPFCSLLLTARQVKWRGAKSREAKSKNRMRKLAHSTVLQTTK